MNVSKITHDNRTQSLQAWADETGIPPSTLKSRVEKLGWTWERALTTPVDRRFRKGGRRRKNAPRPCPELKEHSATGRAFVRWSDGGKTNSCYFGKWGSKEALTAYKRFSMEWAARVIDPEPSIVGSCVFVADIILRWITHCGNTYTKRGNPTSEIHCNRAAMVILNELYGDTRADEFGGKQLRAVREAMILKMWTRHTVNGQLARIVRMFGWAATENLVPVTVHQTLKLVEPIRAGRRADITESVPVQPVPLAHIEAVIADEHLHKRLERRAVLIAMIRTQQHTGMRPGELCSLTSDLIDRTHEPWRYSISEFNKMVHKNIERVVFFGPKARAMLQPLIEVASAGEQLFRFPPRHKKARWAAITPHIYRNRVRLACKSAGVPVWTPNQLRHNKATEVMDVYESDAAAAAALGNTPEVARQVYASRPGEAVAKRIAEQTG